MRSSDFAKKTDHIPVAQANNGFMINEPIVPVMIRDLRVFKISLRRPEKILATKAKNIAVPSINPSLVLETINSSVKKVGSRENTIKDAMLHKKVTQLIAHKALFSSWVGSTAISYLISNYA